MLDALIHRKDRNVTGVTQPSVTEEPLQVYQHSWTAIARQKHTVHEIRRWEMEGSFRDSFTYMIQ